MRREHAARSGRPPPRSQPAGSAPALARPFVETPARASSWEPAPRRWARWPWRPPAPATVTWLPAALGRQDRGLSACGGSKNMSRTATGSSFLPSQTPRPSKVHTRWQTAHLGKRVWSSHVLDGARFLCSLWTCTGAPTLADSSSVTTCSPRTQTGTRVPGVPRARAGLLGGATCISPSLYPTRSCK